ncbi:MAG: hypothetical protein RIN56_03065 [Sporomusaceae bacterium]|nr:hypothetical protein [Sporomusaceae bacterium]
MTKKNPPKLPSWQEFQAALVYRAIKEDDFRRELLTDPTAAVEKELGRIAPGAQLKSHFKLKVVQQQPDELLVILPPGGASLSDADLDNVSGGGRPMSDIVMTGGGPGPNSMPFVFKLDDTRMA